MKNLTLRPRRFEAARVLYGLALLILLCAIFLPSLLQHFLYSQDPARFSDDVLQQVVPFLHYHDSELFSNDYSTDYFLAAVPSGYRLFYGTLSRFADPLVFTRSIHFILLGLVLAGVFLAAYRFSGFTGAFLAVAVCLSADIYLVKMAGGLPRAYAFPLFSLGTAALVWGRMRLFALMTLLAAAFYPLVAVVFMIALALSLSLLPARDRGSGQTYPLRRRISLLALVAFAVGLVALPPVVRLGPYGPSITPSEIGTFPEAGPGGRLRSTDHPPFAGFLASSRMYAKEAFAGSGEPLSRPMRELVDPGQDGRSFNLRHFLYKFYLIIGLSGLALLLRKESGGRRLALLLLSVWTAHRISLLAAPALFIPERYLAYTVPPLIAVALPASLAAWGRFFSRSGKRPWTGPCCILLLGGLFLGFLGTKGSTHAGLTVYVALDKRPFYRYVATLPKSAVIAGMPSGPVNYLPYLSRRKVLISFENHQVFHKAYALEMRERMKALLEAYYATTLEPLRALREGYGVTHLVVSRRDYERVPTYFRPFNKMLLRGFRRVRKEGSQVLKLIDKAGVFTFSGGVLLDLSRID